VPFAGFVGDVKDAERVREVIAGQKPAIVFHAAAYKHVPLMEEENCWQAVRNNVFGTWVMAAETIAAKVPRFVLVSTDKAVNPTNVMGATKRLAEIAARRCSQRRLDAGQRGAVRQRARSAGSVIRSSRSRWRAAGRSR